MAADHPRFSVGDDAGSLRITLRTSTGVVIDPTTPIGGEARLYANGFDNDDKPGAVESGDTRKSIKGEIGANILDENGNKCVEFKPIGTKCSIEPTKRLEQLYPYKVQFIDGDGLVWRQAPEGYFVVEAWVT